MNCDPNSLIEAAKCYRCIPKGMHGQVVIYLLCQWANNLTPAVSISWTPSTRVAFWDDSMGGFRLGDLPTFLATADIPTVTALRIPGSLLTPLTALSGLQSLPALQFLDVGLSGLGDTNLLAGTLDISNLVNLSIVYADGNLLTHIDAHGCVSLTTLTCASNANLTTLTLTGCTAMVTLDCSSCSVTGTLDVSPCAPALTTLNCSSNALLTTLTLTGCTALVTLDCSSCNINPSLDVSPAAPSLTTLNCSSNSNLTGLNLTGCTSVVTLICSVSNITGTLDVSPCAPSLATLLCTLNANLTGLTLTGCTSLTDIEPNSCGLNQAAVDNVLCTTDINGAINGFIDITFNTAPSPAGLVCSANLDPGKGWTVAHD